jgi:hypothetical protein
MLPTIILVHGAFAESASWDRVIDTLQNVGRHHRVIAAANPLEYADHLQPSLLDGGRFEPRSSRDPPFDNLGGRGALAAQSRTTRDTTGAVHGRDGPRTAGW